MIFKNKQSIEIELLKKTDKFEVGAVNGKDLMKIKCFATHEGVNENGTSFTREMLLECYHTFIDKPLILVSDIFGKPTGHGFDYSTGKFDTDKRKQVGHISNAYPCIVKDNGEIVEVSGVDIEDFPEGEFRIICDLIFYKFYLSEIAEIIYNLHTNGMLKFSMEGLTSGDIDENGIKHCTSIQFTGLAIVKYPAFKNSFSLEVAEKKEKGGTQLEFEKLYNELKVTHDALIATNAVTVAELLEVKAELVIANTELEAKEAIVAEKDVELATVVAEVENLKPFKEKVESEKKAELGKKRFERLSKLGAVDKTAEELSTMDQETYSALLEDALDKATTTKKTGSKTETAETKDTILGLIVNDNAGTKTNKQRLTELLEGFTTKA